MFNFSCNKICTHSAILLVKNNISNAITSIPTEYEKKNLLLILQILFSSKLLCNNMFVRYISIYVVSSMQILVQGVAV